MFARLVTIGGRREHVDEFARFGTDRVLPQLKRLEGFEGSLVLANRRSGEIVAVTLWESEEAMRATEGASYWFRAFSAEAAGGEELAWEGTRSSPRRRGERSHSATLARGLGLYSLFTQQRRRGRPAKTSLRAAVGGIVQEANGYKKPTRYGDAAVGGRHVADRWADPGAGLQVVGRGEPGVRPRGDRAGDTAGPARRTSQRTLPRDRALARRRVHRDRGLGTLAVRRGTLAYGARTLLLLDRTVERLAAAGVELPERLEDHKRFSNTSRPATRQGGATSCPTHFLLM
jgi:heme-degrading monooxygenase HmoA